MNDRLTRYRLDMVTVLSVDGPLWTSARPGLPQYNPDSTIRLAETGLGGEETLLQDALGDGTLVQYVSPIYRSETRVVEGAVVVSYFVPKNLATILDDVNRQANVYQQAEAQRSRYKTSIYRFS